MKKYIIRNCPAMYGIDDGFLCSYREDDEDEKYCYDCTDCVMKQIVKLCKKAIKDCDKCKGDPEIDCYDCTQGGKAIQSDKILELLDIEEVE